MARLRREPKPEGKPPVKRKPLAPLHQRILGKNQTELDTVEDLRYKLELAYNRDDMEFDTYSQCHDALDFREAKAKEGLLKATGRFIRPDKQTTIKVRHKPVKHHSHKSKHGYSWRIKLLCVLAFLFVWKILSFKP